MSGIKKDHKVQSYGVSKHQCSDATLVNIPVLLGYEKCLLP